MLTSYGFSPEFSLTIKEIRLSDVRLPDGAYFLATALCLMGLLTILANSFVMGFYQKKWKEPVPLMYILIGVCDSITGVIAICHAIIFIIYPGVLYTLMEGSLSSEVTVADSFLIIVYIILQSGTRTSLFYNTVLTVVRTVNITQPFVLIKKYVILVCAILYPLLWIATLIADIKLDTTADQSDLDKRVNDGLTIDVVEVLFLMKPGDNLMNVATQSYTRCDLNDPAVDPGWSMCNHSSRKPLFLIIFMVIPLILPAIISLVCAVLQILSILKPKAVAPVTARERSMTVTILLLTLICLVCNIPYTVFLFIYSFNEDILTGYFSDTSLSVLSYSMCTMLPFIQALLNPATLLLRGAALRDFVSKTVRIPYTSLMATSMMARYRPVQTVENNEANNQCEASV